MNRDSPRPVRTAAAALAAGAVLAMAGGSFHPSVAHVSRHVVEIRGMAFHPQQLEVMRGDTIVWINRDIVPHTATSTHMRAWTTGPLQPGQSGQYVPRAEGEESYDCRFHPVMVGTVIVR